MLKTFESDRWKPKLLDHEKKISAEDIQIQKICFDELQREPEPQHRQKFGWVVSKLIY